MPNIRQEYIDATVKAYRLGQTSRDNVIGALAEVGRMALEDAEWSFGEHTEELTRIFAEVLLPYVDVMPDAVRWAEMAVMAQQAMVNLHPESDLPDDLGAIAGQQFKIFMAALESGKETA